MTRRAQRSRGGKGKVWESFLDDLHGGWALREEAHILHTYPEIRRVGDGRTWTPTGVGRPDYTGVYRGLHLEEEAKQSNEKRWPYAMLKGHQAQFLDSADRNGGLGLLLLCQTRGFVDRGLPPVGHVVPWMAVREHWLADRLRWEANERLRMAGSRRKLAPTLQGTASMDWASVRAASIYSESVLFGRWAYLDAIDTYMDRWETLDARAQECRQRPRMPIDTSLRRK